MRLPPTLRGARAAGVFLTRLPVGGFPYCRRAWAWAPAWFPVVGALIGLAEAGVWHLALALGVLPAAVLAIGAGILLTGAMHEDGLADTADALCGAPDRERIFFILKDSRVGTYGAVALTLSLLLRVALLVTLAPMATTALVVSQSVSRCAPVWLLTALPYVTAPETAKSQSVTQITWRQAAVATTWIALLLGALVVGERLLLLEAVSVTGALLGGAVLLGWHFQRRVGGITGDFMGAVQQISEVLVLMALRATQAGLV